MEVDTVVRELEALATERTKKSYLSRGVTEPVIGVATGAMKPLVKRIGVDQDLAEALWDTGIYDARYLAGMIADVSVMSREDFERWIDSADYAMLSDFVVAVTLSESRLAQPVADEWVRSGEENRESAGWACYEWLLGWRPDSEFDEGKIHDLLDRAASTIHDAPPRVQRAMRNFIIAVGVSFRPLHQAALDTAERIGQVQSVVDGKPKTLGSAAEAIRAAAEKGRIGFKRRAVRC